MTIVYPLAAQTDYTELKYSLRSLDKFFKSDVIIVGNVIPEWITNITQIKVPDIPGRNVLSVRRKVLAALHCVTDNIFFMNDDFYLLKEVENFPYYSSGSLVGKGESGANQLLKQLQGLNKPFKYYGHYPCIYKKDFAHVLQNFTSDCLTKSAYCNFIEVESIEISDCKLINNRSEGYIKEFIKDRPCFSTGVYSLKSCVPVLEELFPFKSVYEV